MEKKLKQIMKEIKANVTSKGENVKVIIAFLLVPPGEESDEFSCEIIAGIKKNAKSNNYTRVFHNDHLLCTPQEYKDLLIDAYERYKTEVIIPDSWRKIDRFWWGSVDCLIELLDYAIGTNDWGSRMVGFKIIQSY